uniref:Uncharacterized protein n=1 Tax=Rhizophora mucronata TaxID=61149 RepID=A0A2P2KSS6_RHIMU
MAMKDCPNTSQESTGCMCPFEPFLQRYFLRFQERN